MTITDTLTTPGADLADDVTHPLADLATLMAGRTPPALDGAVAETLRAALDRTVLGLDSAFVDDVKSRRKAIKERFREIMR